MNPLDPLKEYGWIAVFVLFLIDRVWPWFANLFATEAQKKSKVTTDQAMASIQAEQESRQAEREERAEERAFRHTVDERQVKAFEDLAASSVAMVNLQVAMNERQAETLRAIATLSNFTMGSVVAMRETVNQLHSQTKPIKLPKVMPPVSTPEEKGE
jgi:hypothetical protein